jgi:predicted ATP-grasp superfamily ATP-dependent carboligase
LTRGMSERLVAFVDDARLLPDLSGSPDVLVISLDSQATSELAARSGLRVRSISEYSEMHFASYDELYAHFKAALCERLRPKDPLRQSRFLFEVLWDDILLSLIPIHYVETLIQEILHREKPTRVEFAISDRALDALFRTIVQQLS